MAIAFHQQQLPSGLTVIAESNPLAHTSAVGFFVKTGARDEQRPLMGVSHFLEHMMFKGTARRSADDVNREFDEIGANYNAFTSEEMTAYWAHVLPEFLPRAVDLLGDMLRPALRQDDFDMEKKVILEEISMYEDRPQWRLYDAIHALHFGQHPLSFRILGTPQTVGDLKVEQMLQYFGQRYSPDNIVVTAAGKIDFAALIDLVSQATSHWRPSGARRVYTDPQLAPRQSSIRDEKITRHYVAIMSPGPSAQDPRRYAAKVLEQCLGDEEGSRLYWALVDPGLADEADFSFDPHDRTGSFFAFASCDPERAAEVEDILLKTIDGFAQQIQAEEIERARNKLATSVTLHSESPGGRMSALGGQWTYHEQYVPLEEELRRLLAVTADDLRQLLEQTALQMRTIVRLGPTVKPG